MLCTARETFRIILANSALFFFRYTLAYSIVFSVIQNIQAYSESCAMLAHAETWHTRNPGIFRTLPSIIISWRIFRNRQIYENLRIFRTLTYLKPDVYAELSQRFTMEFFAEIVKNYNYFSEAFYLRSLTRFCLRNLSISTH